MKYTALLLCTLFFYLVMNFASAQSRIVVDPHGKGNFKTIQEAVNSLTDSSATDRIIYIKTGVYHEQVYIAKHHVILQGENKETTIITGAIADIIYSCNNPGNRYSGIVNLDGDDITLLNLSIENTYGLNAPDSVFVSCKNPNTHQSEKLKVLKNDHQFALRSFQSTRLKVINCIIKGWGADTVAPWNSETGMYYFRDCIMQGGTDFFCPRGWCYSENCTFICLSPTAAAIWHDGHADITMKNVLKNCTFKGTAPYRLGRYHHDALFYLIDCSFDRNLVDMPIYKAATAKEVLWGSRAYYYNCHREGRDFEWFNNNLDKDPVFTPVKNIIPVWAFAGKWDPLQH